MKWNACVSSEVWWTLLAGSRLRYRLQGMGSYHWKYHLTAQEGCTCTKTTKKSPIKMNTGPKRDFQALQCKACHGRARRCNAGYGSPPCTTPSVWHPFSDTSASLLPGPQDVWVFSHRSKGGHSQGNNAAHGCWGGRLEQGGCVPGRIWLARPPAGTSQKVLRWQRPKHSWVLCSRPVVKPG